MTRPVQFTVDTRSVHDAAAAADATINIRPAASLSVRDANVTNPYIMR